MSVSDIIDTVGTGAMVLNITKNSGDALTASGYAAFVKSVTGNNPSFVQEQKGYVTARLTESQAQSIRKYFEDQIWSIFKKQTDKKTFIIDTAPVINPLIFKYVTPVLVGAFIIGYLTGRYKEKRIS